MFLDLINLYNKNISSGKTPLEDFNTESFASILKLYEEVKNDFIYNFLKLPEDNYMIKTQLNKYLPDDPNCIIDLVLEGKENICFIENKVESSEGYNQLERYGKALDLHYPTNFNKYLFYCTKYSDIKNQNEEYSQYNFKQFLWFQVAKILNPYKKNNPLINNYINFLEHYKMAQDNTLKLENLLSMENIKKTIEIIEFHIDNCKIEFKNFFGLINTTKSFKWQQLIEKNRVCNYNEGLLKSKSNAYSEILYSIEFGRLTLRTQIYVASKHEHYEEFKQLSLNDSSIKNFDFGFGFCYYVDTDLSQFLNKDNSETLIKEWFKESFDIMKNLILNNSHLSWNTNFK